MYDRGWFRSYSFDVPVICVGNLAVGGAGKSPQTEYLIRLLKDKYRVAVLSRGYGRQTSGFRYVQTDDTPATVGDEPLQFFHKFGAEVTVAVCERRVIGIQRLTEDHDLIILDDAYQHRPVRAGLNILLFDYTGIDRLPFVLPAGDYRETLAGRKRAQAIVISKTPPSMLLSERQRLLRKVKPLPGQACCCSFLRYGLLQPLNEGEPMNLESLKEFDSVFLITGIANPVPLLETLSASSTDVRHFDYPDHHPFTKKNISKLASEYAAVPAARKIIITTEKDAQRLKEPVFTELLSTLPVYYLPVETEMHAGDKEIFDNLILNYVSEHL